MKDNELYLCVFCSESDKQQIESFHFVSEDRVKSHLIFVESHYPTGEQKKIIEDRGNEFRYLIISLLGMSAYIHNFEYFQKHRPEIGLSAMFPGNTVRRVDNVTVAVTLIDLFFAVEGHDDACFCENCGEEIFPFCDGCGKEVEKLSTVEQSFAKAMKEGWTFFSVMGLRRGLVCPECAYGKCTRCQKPLLETREDMLLVPNGTSLIRTHLPSNIPPYPDFNILALCVDCDDELSDLMQKFMNVGELSCTKNLIN